MGMEHYIASSLWNGNDTHDIIFGVLGSLVSLLLLFSIKPRLRLRWEECSSGDQKTQSTVWEQWIPSKAKLIKCPAPLPKDMPTTPTASTDQLRPGTKRYQVEVENAVQGSIVTAGSMVTVTQVRTPETGKKRYRVEVENLGLWSVVEIEARLWRIERGENSLPTRHRVEGLPVDGLLELPGKWREARRSDADRERELGNRFFHFRLPGEVSKERGEYLFQVWSKHGFTNFGRVHKLRIRDNGADLRPESFGEKRWLPFEYVASATGQVAGYVTRGWRRLARKSVEMVKWLREIVRHDGREQA